MSVMLTLRTFYFDSFTLFFFVHLSLSKQIIDSFQHSSQVNHITSLQ